MSDEKTDALKLAERILDRPSADPDDDLAMLARQLIRATERAEQAEALVGRLRDLVVDMTRSLRAWQTSSGDYNGTTDLMIRARHLLADPLGARLAEEQKDRQPLQHVCTKCGYTTVPDIDRAEQWRAFRDLRDAAWIYRQTWIATHGDNTGEVETHRNPESIVSLGYARGDLFAAVERARKGETS